MITCGINNKIKKAFQDNLDDWFKGGPCPEGWTRTGPALPQKNLRLTHYQRVILSVEEVLAKNKEETESWHIAFLNHKGDWKDTLYYDEYLSPRYNKEDVQSRAESLHNVFNDIKSNGYRKSFPVWVADVGCANLGFRYFRFDGCHRVCCCKVLGIKQIPSYVFMAEEVLGHD